MAYRKRSFRRGGRKAIARARRRGAVSRNTIFHRRGGIRL